MGGMSPLGRFILIVMLWGVRFTALAVAAAFALVIWQKQLSADAPGLIRQDAVFLAILAVVFVAALWFSRAIAREVQRSSL
jgi:hypothetical protein